MQILFVHPNFPAQFGPILNRLVRMPDVDCVFASRYVGDRIEGVRRIMCRPRSGARKTTHYCSRTFENAVWQSHAVYEACKAESDLRPDLIVGHSGFGSTIMLHELYEAPIINLFEYFYHPRGSDLDFRPDFPAAEIDALRSRLRNAMILLDLEACDAGYSPTRWQRSLLPREFFDKVRVIHDGIDTDVWRPHPAPRRIGDETIPEKTRIVTYVSRGFESMRGFDIFIRVAGKILERIPDVLFLCVGTDKIHYGNDLKHTGGKSLREYVLEREKPDLSRFRFPGRLPPGQLADLLAISDLHIYLTVPFVLSWSMLNAMACGCLVLASDTEPVREFIRDGETGLLCGFFDVDGFAERAVEALRDPEDFRALRSAAQTLIETDYGLDRSFAQMWALFRDVMDAKRS